jgi:hypothetical protein
MTGENPYADRPFRVLTEITDIEAPHDHHR